MRRIGALAVGLVVVAGCGGGTATTTTAGTTTAPTTTTTATTTTQTPVTGTWFDGLDVGTCFQDTASPEEGSIDFSVPADVVPCERSHDNEIVALVPITPGDGGAFPGTDAASAESLDLCLIEYESFLGRPIDDSGLTGLQIFPDGSDWELGVTWAVCSVFGSEPLVGSAASAGLSAPGATLAILGQDGDIVGLWLVDGATGSLTTRIATPDDLSIKSQPSWTPDGSAIAVAVAGPDGDGDLFLLSSDGSGSVPLVEAPGDDDRPVISPVGTKFAFVSDRDDGELDIYSIDFDGDGTVMRLTDFSDRDSSPSWSPDGTEIAFRRRADGNSDIYVMNADGTDVRRLTTDPGFDGDPAWSPDGSEILFTSDRSGNYDIWVMNADGSGQLQLTDHPADDEFPSWSPDGELIAFQSDRHGGTSVWIMRWDGSEQTNLTWRAPTGYPAFAPVGIG